ncbi:YqgE/AlgH family protein [Streptomyces boncukensis]|uniref:UPF0301 protein G5C65_30625 n=1 Tax=Streptomyces boncukensis TaxID=2711219 RepID=A0A6G4X5V1_9ACTN|nr:YqgE/AlgH family protein [Streptomyces boncukensis]NGO72633.1 YqgE/AlgH family protein [Streptomyces boncukensis]
MTEVSSLTGRLLVATPVLADPNFDRAVVLLLDHDEEGSLGVVLNRPTPVDVSDILEPWAALTGEPGVVFQGGPVSLDAALGVAVVPTGGEGRTTARDTRDVRDTRDARDVRGPDGEADAGTGAPPGREPAADRGAARDPAPDPAGSPDRARRTDRDPDRDRDRDPDADPGAGDAADAADGKGPSSGPLGWRRVHGAIGLVDLEAPPELLAAELGSLRIFAGYAGWGPGQLEDELSEGAWYVVESEPGDVSSPSPEGLWRSVLRRQRSELALVATYPDDPSLN